MPSKQIEKGPEQWPEVGGWRRFLAATDPATRQEAARYALETVKVPECRRPVPRFMLDLPWAADDEAMADQILTNVLASEDIVGATQPAGALHAEDVLDVPLTVGDLRARESDLRDARWGAYLILSVTYPDGTLAAVTTGAAQACATMWRLWCEGRFPVVGRFVALNNPGEGRSPAIGFVVG